ncbi:hypothetical protein PVAP13_9NG221300 [Panicum virgatum]|uniref:Uncharacterized protein n=1 Tax=Panicum virgatum TaxID=38727 RepID=A0A8T0MK04_PANVG|nr:hypothetical protein PVAP13_9NG221300 [Panicum virgatum]
MVQMEKLVNHCDMELMKMAMLRHEQTFRQQVHELHRMYRVQKQLMMSGGRWRPPSELISCRRHQTRRGRQPRRRALDLGLHLPADDYILVAGADNATPPSPRQEDGLELTLAIGSGGASRSKRREPDVDVDVHRHRQRIAAAPEGDAGVPSPGRGGGGDEAAAAAAAVAMARAVPQPQDGVRWPASWAATAVVMAVGFARRRCL